MKLFSIRIVILTLCLVSFLGCGTVDKRIFYQTAWVKPNLSKEERQLSTREMGCPILAIPLNHRADLLKSSLKQGDEDFQIGFSFGPTHEFEAYWWGPAWVPIVPIYLFKSKEEQKSQFVITITMNKEWVFKTKYDHKDKSTWQARIDEINRAIFPKIKKVTVSYQDQNNERVTESGALMQNFSPPNNKSYYQYGLSLPNPIPENLNIHIEIEDQKFDFNVVKKQSWVFQAYLVGCFP